ncbi:MAG TPA: AI-2E family transporter, partial [Gemmatimonadales bacterium]
MTTPHDPDRTSEHTAELSTELSPEFSSEFSSELSAEHTGERRTGRERRSRWRPSHGWRSRDVLRAAALVLALYWVAKLFWFANPLVLASFLGILFGLAVTAGVDRLQRYRIPRGLGAFVIVFGFLSLIGAFFAWSGPELAAQSRELRSRLPEAIDRIEAWVEANRDSPIAGLILGDSPAAAGSTGTAAQGADSAPAGASA